MISIFLRILLVLELALVTSFVPSVQAGGSVVSEYLVKAAFLYNFAKFVEWPESAFQNSDDTIVLGILGQDPFGDALKSIEGKTIKGRVLVIKHCRNINEISGCHILYIGCKDREELEKIIRKIDGLSVLTVGDSSVFTKAGGIISFSIVQRKVRFEINLKAAKRAKLHISSKLLRLAKAIRN